MEERISMNLKTAWHYATNRVPDCKRVIVKDNDVIRVWITKTKIIFVFDPSNDIEDWASNAKFWGEDEHRGFDESADKFKPKVEEYLRTFVDLEPWFIGYSRGAALATLMTYHFAKKRTNRKFHCRAPESPLVLKKLIAKHYDALNIDHITIRNGWDIVTYMPLKKWGYRHVGKMITLPQPWYHKYFFRVRDHLERNVDTAIEKEF